MGHLLAVVLTFAVTSIAEGAIISSPPESNLVAIRFRSCTDVLGTGYAEPRFRSGALPSDQIGGILGKYASRTDCSADGGSVNGTNGIAPLGAVATLEEGVERLSSFPGVVAKKTGRLRKGSVIRIVLFRGTLSFNILTGRGYLHVIPEVLDAKS